MHKIILPLIFLSLFGCSVIGNELGEVVDKTTGEESNKYKRKYRVEGLKEDIEILKELFTKKKKEEESDSRACKEPHTRQVCTAIKGCWCEKT